MNDEDDRALARMAWLLGPEFVKDAEAEFIKRKTDMEDEHALAKVIAELDEAQRILLKELPIPDMDITEFNATPIGRAIRCINNALETIEDLP